MDFYGDYHMHSTHSDGRGPVEQMVKAASQAGLKEMGITDHGPANIWTGVKNENVFLQVKKETSKLQPDYPDLTIFAGAEANIINEHGDLDISRKLIKQLDYLLAGLHPYARPRKLKESGWILRNHAVNICPALKNKVKNINTKAMVESIYRYDLKAITHPGLKMPIDIPEVARACLKTDTAWEINTGHEFPHWSQIAEAARFGSDFIVNSDAHFPETVGRLEYGSRVLEKAGVSPERVKNTINFRKK